MSESVSTQNNGLRTYRPPLGKFTFNSPELQKRVEKWKQGVLDKTASRGLLLTGDVGLGKTSLALALCEALGAHPDDIQQINCASTRTLDDARDLIARMGFSPAFGKYRVLILDEVHQMVPNAQQAFLTPIENLVEETLLVACTSAPENLLPAFRSRFYEIRLESYSEESLTEILENLPQPPKPKDIATIVRIANGNARRAIALAEGGIGADDHKSVQISNAIDLFVPALMKKDYPTLMLILNQVSESEKQQFYKKVLPLLEGTWMTLMGQKAMVLMNEQKVITQIISGNGSRISAQAVAKHYADLSLLQTRPLESLKGWVMGLAASRDLD